MTFPVFVHIGAWQVHPHIFFEVTGWLAAGALVLIQRRRRGDVLLSTQRWGVASAAAVGAVVGGRALHWGQHIATILPLWREPSRWPVGKTVVGGLIGAVVFVEIAKRLSGIRVRTGDLFAVPLAVGMAIGRIGCFLTGLADDTYGTPTALWTGVDFGDGIRRHPTQLYETAFLIGLAVVLVRARPRLPEAGSEFRLFMVSYLTFRLIIDFIKPEPVLALGLSAIQLACVAMLAYYVKSGLSSAHGSRVDAR